MKHDAKLNRDINMESDAGTSPTVARYFRTMSELADRQYRPSVPPAKAHSHRLGDLAQARRRAELANELEPTLDSGQRSRVKTYFE